jgi:tetratricopeptide (TPR) repeat protein
VESSSLSDRQAILNIIDNVSNPDARDAELKKLSNGQTYRNLLNNFYPPLRRTEYVVAYNVRPFDVDEAREIIKTNPRLLSLNEMYLVAQSYPDGSTEFKEVFDIATRHYPESDIAILNSSSADIELDNIDAAIERMNKIADNPKVWNNLGVAYALKGDFVFAKQYFDKAVSYNDEDASVNIKELNKVIYR